MRKVILLTAMPKESVWSSSIYVNGGSKLLSSKISFSKILLLFVCCIFCNNVFAQVEKDWRLVQNFESLTSSGVKACQNSYNGEIGYAAGQDLPDNIAKAEIIPNVEGHGKVGQFQIKQGYGYKGQQGIVFSVNLGSNILSAYTDIRLDIKYVWGDCTNKEVKIAVRNGSSDAFYEIASKRNELGSVPEGGTSWVTDFTFGSPIKTSDSSVKDYSNFEMFISLDTQSNPVIFQIDNIELYGPAIGSSAVEIDETKNNTITAKDNATVNLTRSLVKGMWNTICLPFVPSSDQVIEIFGEGAKFAQFSSVSNGVMQFTSVAGSLVAGRPYLVLPTKSQTAESPIVLTGVNITATEPETVSYGNGDYSFIGIYSPTPFAIEDWDEIRFVGTGNQLLKPSVENPDKPNESNPLKALRAYFSVPVPSGSGAKNYTFAVDSFVPTSIANIQIEGDGDGAIYNIGGQRVEGKSLPKGIYIRDGKKFVVK